MKKKICYFVNSAWYFELHWLERGKAALDAGYDVYVLANFSDSLLYDRLMSEGFKCINSAIREKTISPFSFINDTRRTFKILNLIEPDIIHNITIKPGVIGSLWAKMKNKRLVYSFVGLGRIFENKKVFYIVIKNFIVLLYRYLFSATDCKIIFEHKEDQDKVLFLTKVKRDKTIVIDGAGIDVASFSYTEEEKHEKAKVLFASRMLWSKGLSDLIRAKKILHLKGVEFDILVAGIIVEDDSDAIDIKQIEDWHRSGDIIWLGKRNDINILIKDVNVVALPSIYPEGIPRIILEAGAVGRACIVYDIGGCSSLIKNGYNGFVVAKQNVNELAEKLGELIIFDEERYQMGLNARENIIKKYSSNIIIKETLSVYEKLLS